MHADVMPADEIRFLRLPEVIRRVGLQKTKIYDMMKKGEFPKAEKVGRASVWPDDVVRNWQASVRSHG